MADDAAFELMKAVYGAGVTFWDTAEAYSCPLPDGSTKYNETVLGDAIRALGLPRDELQLATKIMPTLHGDSMTAESCIAACQASCDRLGVGPISWTGAPKKTQSFALIFESTKGGGELTTAAQKAAAKTHWLLYDIPPEVTELREELSGAGSSEVSRLGMKDDAGQAPVVVDPMGAVDGWVDPEIKAMQDMIHNAVDLSFEDEFIEALGGAEPTRYPTL